MACSWLSGLIHENISKPWSQSSRCCTWLLAFTTLVRDGEHSLLIVEAHFGAAGGAPWVLYYSTVGNRDYITRIRNSLCEEYTVFPRNLGTPRNPATLEMSPHISANPKRCPQSLTTWYGVNKDISVCTHIICAYIIAEAVYVHVCWSL